MLITLYTFQKRTNSTKQPEELGKDINVKLKEGCSIYNPSFILNEDIQNYNYFKWNDRYYYIDDIELIREHLYNLTASIDVLATYKKQILDTKAFVSYSTSKYNISIPDQRLSNKIRPNYTISKATLIDDAVNDMHSGTFILNYITNKPTNGLAGQVWCSSRVASNIAQCLGSGGMDEFLLDKLKKQLSNVYQAVRSCRYVPMRWWTTEGDDGYTPPSAGGGGGGEGGKPNPEGFTPRLSATSQELKSLIFYSNPINPLYPANAPSSVGGNLNAAGNCTWYAWGRFWEICGAKHPPKLPSGNASTWYPNASGYARGQKPKVGAVACWGVPNVEFGHVAIVEEVLENGVDFKVSNSAYPNSFFFTHTLLRSNNYFFEGAGAFQGFIYNSCVEG